MYLFHVNVIVIIILPKVLQKNIALQNDSRAGQRGNIE